MRKLGFLIALIGMALCVLPFTGSDVEWLHWIDTWGANRGWLIRGGTIILGLLIILIAPLPDE